jgi:CNT family concentrative nucleoside transporter
VIVPEVDIPYTASSLRMTDGRPDRNGMEAAARGATEGIGLAINVAAMLIAFVGLMAMADWALSLAPVGFCADGVHLGGPDGCNPRAVSRVPGWIFTPVALLMGVDLSEAPTVGMLLGEKLVLTEFVAYIHLGDRTAGPAPRSPRAAVIASDDALRLRHLRFGRHSAGRCRGDGAQSNGGSRRSRPPGDDRWITRNLHDRLHRGYPPMREA